MAGLHPAERTRGLGSGAGQGGSDPEPPGYGGAGAAHRVRRPTGGLPGTRSRTVRARLPRIRQRGPRLGLLVQGLRGHGRSSRPGRSGGRSPGLRRDATAGLCRARTRSAEWRIAVATPGAGAQRWTRLRQDEVQRWRTGGISPRPCGASPARHRGPRRCAVQRRRTPPDLCPPRRKLRLDGLPLRGPDQYRRPPALLSVAPAAIRTAAARTAPRPAARRPARKQPQVPERGLRASLGAGSARTVRAPPRLPSRSRLLRRRAPA